ERTGRIMSTATATKHSETHSTPATGANRKPRLGDQIVDWMTTTDHKKIGSLYLVTSFLYFCLGGVMALVIRAQLVAPGNEILQSMEQYNQLFTMHGTIMLLMFATPLFVGFANWIMPLDRKSVV